MSTNTDDLRIRNLRELLTPEALIDEMPASDEVAQHVTNARAAIQSVLDQSDDRLVVVVGPCSIHDPDAALDYAARLKQFSETVADQLLIVMRVYFEKPRTTVGWKGLINDPHLDNSFDVNEGLRRARRLLLDINAAGLPTATEYLDLISPQYIADLISWGAIGARTTESQSHRELASGLSCPVGFKNGTGGNVQIAVDAIGAAQHSHHFLSVTKGGRSAIFETAGNPYCHLILRGGPQPNYDMFSVDDASAMLKKANLRESIMIDASHANSRKQPHRQVAVVEDISSQVERGDHRITGIMLESFIEAGRQDVVSKEDLVYGKSITDPCMDWAQTEQTLTTLAEAVGRRRQPV
jgi:3-deoxy-7-phosphoheptulonate synthase